MSDHDEQLRQIAKERGISDAGAWLRKGYRDASQNREAERNRRAELDAEWDRSTERRSQG